MTQSEKELFKQELLDNLTRNILPYWLEKMRDPRGGYYGRRDGHDILDADAPKGGILHARILWTFSAAYRLFSREEYLNSSYGARRDEYLEGARHALDFIRKHFIDREYGGAYWSVAADGKPLDTKKQYYAIAFMIYGLAEYYLATGDESALDDAYALFESIETHARDRERGGYIEASTRDWQPIADMRLSEHDANASKTMNTHLHILEGYTNLLRALKAAPSLTGRRGALAPHVSAELLTGKRGALAPHVLSERVAAVKEATTSLLRTFLTRIENPKTHHLTLFFNDDWEKYDDIESYGHDIEASWLMLESAEVIGDPALYAETLAHTRQIALAGLEGRQPDGSMVYELHRASHADASDPDASDADAEANRLDADRHWWVQAENVIGQLYQARFHSEPESKEEARWLADARQSWRYIADNLVDPEGEWYWSRHADGSINRLDDKAGFWKCPYHNSRMCIESLRCLR